MGSGLKKPLIQPNKTKEAKEQKPNHTCRVTSNVEAQAEKKQKGRILSVAPSSIQGDEKWHGKHLTQLIQKTLNLRDTIGKVNRFSPIFSTAISRQKIHGGGGLVTKVCLLLLLLSHISRVRLWATP